MEPGDPENTPWEATDADPKAAEAALSDFLDAMGYLDTPDELEGSQSFSGEVRGNRWLIAGLNFETEVPFVLPEGGECFRWHGESPWLSDEESEKALATSICNECPLRAQCERLARKNGVEYGVWGGVDMEDEHLDSLPPCKEAHNAWAINKASGKPVCVECRRAHSAASYERRKARRATEES